MGVVQLVTAPRASLRIVGLLLLAAGAAALFGGARLYRLGRADALARARNPDRPWLWRADWASGRIVCATGLWGSILAGAGGFLIALCLALAWDEPHAALLLFAAIGLALLGLGIRGLRSWRHHGDPVLELSTLPGVIGGRLAGVVRFRAPVAPPGRFRATLSCKNQMQESGTLLWQDEDLIAPARVSLGHDGLRVPVSFAIPYDREESRGRRGQESVQWSLEIRSVGGRDACSATFTVPVFRTADSRVSLDETQIALASAASQAPAETTSGQPTPVGVGTLADGRRCLELRPGRHPRQAGLISLCTAFWALCAWLWIDGGGTGAGPASVFALVGGFLLFNSLTWWLRGTRVLAGPSGLEVTTYMLGVARRRLVRADEITGIDLKLRVGIGYPFLYDLRFVRAAGRPVTIGYGLASRDEARRLGAVVWNAVKTRS
jgi:hypothetical protein